MCYKVPTAKHSDGVLNVTKVTIISHLITISYRDLFSCRYETSFFKNDAGFKAVSELEKILLLFFRLCCVYWASTTELHWYETTTSSLVLGRRGGFNVKDFLSLVALIAS